MIVRENISFERGQDPKSTMGLGIGGIIDKEMREYIFTHRKTLGSLFSKGDQGRLEWAVRENNNEWVDWVLKSGKDFTLNPPNWKVMELRPDVVRLSAEFANYPMLKKLLDYGFRTDERALSDIVTSYVSSSAIGKRKPYQKILKALLDTHEFPTEYMEYLLNNFLFRVGDRRSQIAKILRQHLEQRSLKESINFNRGESPKETIGLGIDRLFKKIKDRIAEEEGPEFYYHPVSQEIYKGIPIVLFMESFRKTGKATDARPYICISYIHDNFYESGFFPTPEESIDKEKKKIDHLMENPDSDFYTHLSKSRMNESVNFERGKDPREVLGLGIEQQIENFLKSVDQSTSNIDHKLKICARYGKVAFVEYLIKQGANPRAQGDIALIMAVNRNDADMVETLLKAGSQWGSRYISSHRIKKISPEIKNLLDKYKNELDESLDFERGKNAMDTLKLGIRSSLQSRKMGFSIEPSRMTSAILRIWNDISKALEVESPDDVFFLGRSDSSSITRFPAIPKDILENISPYIFTDEAIKKSVIFDMGTGNKYQVYQTPWGKILKEMVWGNTENYYVNYETAKELGLYKYPILNESLDFEKGQSPKKVIGIGGIDIMAEIKKMYNYNDSESVSDETYQRIKKFLSSFLDKQIEGTFKKGFFDEIGEYKFVPFKFIIYFGGSKVIFEDKVKMSYEVIPGERYFIKLDEKMNESIDFERGMDPKRAMKIGLPKEFPDVLSAADWASDHIELVTNGKYDLETMDIDFYGDALDSINNWLGTVHIADIGDIKTDLLSYASFLRALKELLIFRKRKLLGESIRFERGSEPYRALNVGMDRLIKNGEPIDVLYKGDIKKCTAIDDEELDERTGRRFIDFVDPDGDMCWAVRNENGEWIVPSANESVHFERGQDPKKTLDIGVNIFDADGLGLYTKNTGFSFDDEYAENILSDLSKSHYGRSRYGDVLVNRLGSDGSQQSYSINYLTNGPGEYDYIRYKGNLYPIPNPNNKISRRFVKESYNFERGQDPKDALEIGDIRLKIPQIVNEYEELIADIQTSRGYRFQSKFVAELRDILRDYDLLSTKYGWGNLYQGFPEIFPAECIRKIWSLVKKYRKMIDKGIRESVSFERSENPKSVIGIGMNKTVREMIERLLIKDFSDIHEGKSLILTFLVSPSGKYIQMVIDTADDEETESNQNYFRELMKWAGLDVAVDIDGPIEFIRGALVSDIDYIYFKTKPVMETLDLRGKEYMISDLSGKISLIEKPIGPHRKAHIKDWE